MARKLRKRANGDGSIYEVADGWMAEITLPNGKPKRARAKTQAQAREKLRQLLAAREQGVDLGRKQPTLQEWCQIWLDEFTTNLKPNIRQNYRDVVRRYITSAAIARRRLDQLTPAEVQAWVNALTKQVAAKTVQNAHARLHKALAVAVRQGYVSRNVADGTELPPYRPHEIQPPDLETLAKLLEAFEGHRLAALYRLAVNLGMRQAELTGLTWDCIDLRARTITIRQQLQRIPGEQKQVFALQTTKTRAGTRTLTLDDDLVAIVANHQANQAEERALRGDAWRDPFMERGGLVFTTETGGPLFGGLVVRPFKMMLKRIGLPSNLRFHDLRHAAATLMLADGVPLVTVSKVLGHSTPAITAQIYAHALDEQKASAIAGLSAKLRRTEG
jgi:integrase